MKVGIQSLKWIVVAAVVAGAGGKEAVGRSQQPAVVATEKGYLSALPIRVLLKNGVYRMLTLDGVGCSESICSRVTINSRAHGDSLVGRTRLDSISAIRDVKGGDALFILTDGSEKRLSVVPLNRVLYLTNESRTNEMVDLAEIDSVEFLTLGSK